MSPPGYVTGSWGAEDVVRIWDVYLEEGRQYLFRQYHTPFLTGLDAGIHLMLSGATVLSQHQPKAAAVARSDSRPPSQGGEWFTHVATETKFHGLVMGMNNAAPGGYSLWHGPGIYAQSCDNFLISSEVAFASTTPIVTRWAVYGARPGRHSAIDISIFEEDNFSSLNGSSTGLVDEVNFIAVDYDAAPLLDPEYHRYRRPAGTGALQIEHEGGFENIVFDPAQETIYELSWGPGDIVKSFNLWIDGTFDLWQEVDILIHDVSGHMDLGAAVFATAGEQHVHFARDEAEVLVDDQGTGGSELMHFNARFPDWHGLIVFNNNTQGGDYRIILREPSAVPTPETVVLPTALRLAPVANPFRGSTSLRVELPAAGDARLRVHDVSGRLVREHDRARARLPRDRLGRTRRAWPRRGSGCLHGAAGYGR